MPPKSLAGPLFWWEILRQSRRAQGHLTRAFYALALLIWLGINLGFAGTLTSQTISQRTENCVNGYLVAQYLAVIIFTPVFVVSSIVEDRKHRTYELLLTTLLTGREILLDKMASRMLQVLGVLAAGLPVLAVLQMLGGVNFSTVLTHTSIAVLLMVSLAGYCIRAAVAFETFSSGVAMAVIAFTFLSMFLFATVNVVAGWLVAPGELSGVFIVLVCQLLLAWLMVYGAAAALEKRVPTIQERERDLVRTNALVQTSRTDPTYQRLIGRPAEHARHFHAVDVPRIGDYPIVWKERYFPLPDFGCIIPAAAMTVCFALWALLPHFTRQFESISIASVIVSMLVLLVTVCMRACVTFSDERERKTLGDLLLLPIRRQFLIFHKWFGCIARYLPLTIASVCVIVLIPAIRFDVFVAIVPLFFVQFCFYTMLALRLSLSRLSTRHTRLIMIVILLGSNALWIVHDFLKETWPLAVCMLSPVMSATQLAPRYRGPPGSFSYRYHDSITQFSFAGRWGMYVIMLLVLTLATWLLFRSCDRALQRYQERYND
jgi:hypothetical protein